MFTFIEEKYANTPPSNIFLKAYTKTSAVAAAIKHFEEKLEASGFKGADYRVEAFPSTMNEAMLYSQQKAAGKDTKRVSN